MTEADKTIAVWNDTPSSDSEIISQAMRIVMEAVSQALLHPNQSSIAVRKMLEWLESLLSWISWVRVSWINANWLYKDLPALSDSQYVIPDELMEINDTILWQLSSDSWNCNYAYSWLMFYGSSGTGKSEYIRYLKWKLWDKINIYNLNIPAIIASPSPAEALKIAYDRIQEESIQKGKYIVVLLDEVDIFMRQYSSVKNTSSRSTQSGGERHTEQVHSVSESTIDQVGSQLFSTLKSIMSWSWAYDRVYTVATTNEDSIPLVLWRDGRFQAVNIKPPFLEMRSIREATDYKNLAKCIRIAIEIFWATYCRIEWLTEIPKEYRLLLKEAKLLESKMTKVLPKQIWVFQSLDKIQIQKIRTLICDFLEIPEVVSMRGFYIWKYRWYEFHEKDILSWIATQTQSSIAGRNKKNSQKNHLPTKDPKIVKEMLRELFFAKHMV